MSKTMNWSITGFSPGRVAWMTAIISLLLLNIHTCVLCETSGVLMLFGIALLFVTGFVTMADRSEKEFGPFWLALFAALVHSSCVH